MLPKLDVPVYELKLPLLDKIVRYRPFLVKEEKLLLMAIESNDNKSMVDAIKQIVNNCLIDDINISEMPITDLEYLFLNLRAKSVGEVVELQYKCNNVIKKENDEEKSCGGVFKFQVNLLEVTPEIDKNHNKKIELTSTMGIVMKYPNFNTFQNLKDESAVENIIKIIIGSVDYIYDEDTIFYNKDVPEEEMQQFMENLTREQFSKIQNFFETLPKIKKDINFKCPKCDYTEDIAVEGIQNFFV